MRKRTSTPPSVLTLEESLKVRNLRLRALILQQQQAEIQRHSQQIAVEDQALLDSISRRLGVPLKDLKDCNFVDDGESDKPIRIVHKPTPVPVNGV